MKRTVPGWLAAGLAGAVAIHTAWAFDFDRIERWAGSGSNRAALVVDWHDGTDPHALAWGFRWDGEATGLDMWRAVTNADSGLSGMVTNPGDRPVLTGIEYRRPFREYDIVGSATGTNRIVDLLPGTGGHNVRWTAYAWDHTGAVFQAGIWSYWTCDGTAMYPATNYNRSASSLANRFLADGSWDAWSFGATDQDNAPGWPAAAIHYPFAAGVIQYDMGDGTTYPDWISGDLFTNPITALGRPTVDTTGDNWYIPLEQPVPVVPVYPAFRAHEMVMICKSGSVTLAFDHPVLDNPDNPCGVDFIVFGNSFQVIGGGQGWTNGNPSATTVGGSCFIERGHVSVSQDGVNWIEYTNGPYADDFAPTLGRVYDTNNVQTDLGPWNLWWGGATDPTIPVDPKVAPSNWSGYTVAELSQRYRGGAGGVAFDLSSLPLTPDTNTGHKWIQYIRVVRSGSVNPEVDAVADVSPLPPYARWETESFPWMHEPLLEGDDADADGDRIANLLEYALGRDPTNSVNESAFAASVCSTSTPPVLLVQFTAATNATDVSIHVEQSDSLTPANWGTNGVAQAAEVSAPTHGVRRITGRVPAETGKGFLRIKVHHEE